MVLQQPSVISDFNQCTISLCFVQSGRRQHQLHVFLVVRHGTTESRMATNEEQCLFRHRCRKNKHILPTCSVGAQRADSPYILTGGSADILGFGNLAISDILGFCFSVFSRVTIDRLGFKILANPSAETPVKNYGEYPPGSRRN